MFLGENSECLVCVIRGVHSAPIKKGVQLYSGYWGLIGRPSSSIVLLYSAASGPSRAVPQTESAKFEIEVETGGCMKQIYLLIPQIFFST